MRWGPQPELSRAQADDRNLMMFPNSRAAPRGGAWAPPNEACAHPHRAGRPASKLTLPHVNSPHTVHSLLKNAVAPLAPAPADPAVPADTCGGCRQQQQGLRPSCRCWCWCLEVHVLNRPATCGAAMGSAGRQHPQFPMQALRVIMVRVPFMNIYTTHCPYCSFPSGTRGIPTSCGLQQAPPVMHPTALLYSPFYAC